MSVDLSVVVAMRQAEGGGPACLERLASQRRPGVEVIVVRDEPNGDAPSWAEVCTRPGGLVPELWAEGIRRSRGRVVALTTASVLPSDDWVARTLSLHGDGAAAVGGPVESGPGLRGVDWAVYLCRYAAYMLPLDGVPDLPGDNASYDGVALRTYAALYGDGFWEPFVHARMRADGYTLTLRPERVVRHAPGARWAAFSRQRFRHGRTYGEMSARGEGGVRTLVRVALAPLVAPLMTLRTARHVLRKRRFRARLAAALPLLLWFYGCWAAGEAAGRLGSLRR